MSVSNKKSILASFVWRVWGVIFLAIVTYAFTGNLITTTLITFAHHFIFLWVYYFHERFWTNLKNEFLLKHKRFLRPILYEVVLANIILGSISLIFTGSWITTSFITLFYTVNKLWMYVVYDRIRSFGWAVVSNPAKVIGWRQKEGESK